jgi:protein-S-isoprenylcysteine O-methyltransferase Ste14
MSAGRSQSSRERVVQPVMHALTSSKSSTAIISPPFKLQYRLTPARVEAPILLNNMFALAKVPLLLISAALVRPALTPPQPPPKDDETEKYSGVRDPYPWFVAFITVELTKVSTSSSIVLQDANLTRTAKALCWINAVCESSVILAKTLSSYPLSQSILSNIVFIPGGAENVGVTTLWLAGCLLVISGSLIRLTCYQALGKNFTWQLTVKQDHVLVTDGLYSIVRHPAYLGSTTIYAGMVLLLFGPGSWFYECIGWDHIASRVLTAYYVVLVFLVPNTLWSRATKEDEVLHKEFGQQWETWAKKTPYRVVPHIF